MNITCLVWGFFLSFLTQRSTVELFMNIEYEIVCCLVREILKCRYFQILDTALNCIENQFWKDSMSFTIKMDIYWKFNIENLLEIQVLFLNENNILYLPLLCFNKNNTCYLLLYHL